ncbi:oligoendopeptidase F [Dolosicoccus paucivorans]|nr:oligoendopeptidase F [Dolosicoccus paucivorans]
MSQQLKERSAMDPNFQWDLTSLFADDNEWQEAYDKANKSLEDIEPFKGTLGQSSEQLLKAIETLLAIQRQITNIYVYSHLKNDQDQTNSTYQEMHAKAVQLYSQFGQAVAFFNPELLSIPQETLAQFIEENDALKEYEQYLDDATRYRPHVLSEQEELLLAQASEIFGSPSTTFGMLNNADLKFPEIEDEEGNKVQLTHSVYGKMLESSNRRVRKDTFEAFYSVYDQFKNTIASILNSEIKTNNYRAKVRKFDSARQASLFRNNIPEAVYDTLLNTVGERLELLHRYVNLRKELLNVEQLEMYDMYTPLLGDAPIEVTYEEAKRITLEALAPLGEEYHQILQKAFDEQWIDLYENKGKRSGAYSSGSYDSKPYILMNWQDTVNWLYTLVHELGHSVHSYLTRENQPYVYGSYAIFLAEIASTTNENLLTDYLLKEYKGNREVELYILNHFLDGLKGTVFRQTQFAEFEHLMHESDAKGIPLTQEYLSQEYRRINEKYYGSGVNSDSEIALEWTRIPHFYMNYYVFQYATGFAAATAFSKRILDEEPEALDKYLTFLKSGCSQYPIETMKQAGLDMTQADYIDATLDVFEQRLGEFEDLLHSK